MGDLEVRTLTPAFGVEVIGFDGRQPLDDDARQLLQGLFDERGLLLFRDVTLSHAEQVQLCKMLIRKDVRADGDVGPEIGPEMEDNFYISNKRPDSAVPFGRLQFHSDTMWASQPFEVLSLYAMEIEEPVVPTTFVSATRLTTSIAAADVATAGTVPVTVFTPAPGGGTSASGMWPVQLRSISSNSEWLASETWSAPATGASSAARRRSPTARSRRAANALRSGEASSRISSSSCWCASRSTGSGTSERSAFEPLSALKRRD